MAWLRRTKQTVQDLNQCAICGSALTPDERPRIWRGLAICAPCLAIKVRAPIETENKDQPIAHDQPAATNAELGNTVIAYRGAIGIPISKARRTAARLLLVFGIIEILLATLLVAAVIFVLVSRWTQLREPQLLRMLENATEYLVMGSVGIFYILCRVKILRMNVAWTKAGIMVCSLQAAIWLYSTLRGIILVFIDIASISARQWAEMSGPIKSRYTSVIAIDIADFALWLIIIACLAWLIKSLVTLLRERN